MNQEEKDNPLMPDADPDVELEQEAQAPSEASPSEDEQLDELNQRLLRVSADYQNYVKRSQTNLQVSLDQQLMGLARELVTVLDHFDRAVEVDPETVNASDLLDGVLSIRDELMRSLNRYGVERLDVAPGQAFDPNQHEAMMRTASDEIESSHVVAQFQPGYTLKDKTIRPAGVSVAE